MPRPRAEAGTPKGKEALAGRLTDACPHESEGSSCSSGCPHTTARLEAAVMGTAYVVVGSTGAGKSTFARNLAAEAGAIRFAIDEWMTSLYFAERPPNAGFDWYMPRIERCLAVIWDVATQALARNLPVVLEIGLTRKQDREAFCAKVVAAGHQVALRVVDAAPEVRWLRVEQRNQQQGETFSFQVTREMFDFVETMWEAPDDAELARCLGTRTWTGDENTS